MRTNLAERLGYEPEEETRERQERLLEELRYREAMLRVAGRSGLCAGGDRRVRRDDRRMRRDRRDRAGPDHLRDPVKPVKDEPKIPVELRPDQLDDIVDAVLAFADDCANDREILQSMPRVDRDTVEDLLQRESALQTLAAWLQHVQEESE